MTRRRRLARLLFAQLAGLLGLVAVAGVGIRASSAATPQRPVLDVVVVVDTSSRAGAELGHARQAVLSYVDALPMRSRVALVPYGRFPAVQRDLRPVDSGLIRSVRTLAAEGSSPLLDALSLAADQFDPLAQTQRVVVVVSDGADEGSRTGINTVKTQLLRSKAQVQVLSLAAAGTGTRVLPQLVFATKGDLVVAVDRSSVVALAQRTGVQAVNTAKANEKPVGIEKFLRSRQGYLTGIVAIFLAAAVALMLLFAPKPERVSFDLITSPTPTGARALVGRLSTVAEDALERRGQRSLLERQLERAGIDLRPGEFLLVAGGIAAGVGLLGWYVSSPLVGGAITATLLLLQRSFLRSRTRRRQSAFSMQLGDTLSLLTGNLRAGHGLLHSLEMVHREAESPTAQEFGRVVVETRLGRDLGDALHALADRMECEDLRWVIPAIDLNREVGGDLARVLENIGQTIRDRADIKRQVKTLSAEGRLSAYVLIALPFALLAVLQVASPKYLSELTSGVGLVLSGVAALLMAIGGTWLVRMCRIDY